jgi:hypothetical protein
VRARNIKPGICKNEDLGSCSIAARFLFATLPMMADREGRLDDRPRRIRAELFPYDTNIDVNSLLAELEGCRDRDGSPAFIVRYSDSTGDYIQIKNFHRHQNPHYSEKPSQIPECSKNGHKELLEGSRNIPGELQENSERKPEVPPPDSLNHDSLIHDSLIPDSPNHKSNPEGPDGPLSPLTTVTALNPPKIDPCPHEKIIALYHETLPELPIVREWDDTSKRTLKARWREKAERQSLKWWEGYFQLVRCYPYLMGQNNVGWTATLGWLIGPKNMAKVFNGNYQSREPPLKGKLTERGIRNLAATESYLQQRGGGNAGH